MGFFSWLFRRNKRKIKLGLALGSGGAKGFAELGAIRAFEENGIEFDCVAGTSIGSIVGAFYADGYSSTDITELLKKVDFGKITNLLMLNMDTSGLFDVIDMTIGNKNIEELKKPFMTVATEVESGEEKVFDKGSVATALCSSSSYPPFFKPVVVGDKRYIDGAFCNSVPADLVRKMGADFVVGIDLSDHIPKPASLLEKIFTTYKGKIEEPWSKGYEFSDVMIRPDLKDYKPTSFSKGALMFEAGYKAAIEAMPEIKKGIEETKRGGRKR